ncbi:MAG: desulfoferrodoxin [Lachnospiraceae bacterium]|jgi:superoxide reductase|nr:desulfoferrodoxin [Lachnospiraceae bacterium]
MNFYKCSECQGIAMELVPGTPGHEKKFQELAANTTDASGEKHVPVTEEKGDRVMVKVGELEHPMLEGHYIMWIYLETEQGGCFKKLSPGDKPQAEFLLPPGDKPVAAYEYCNLHGLWKANIGS